MIEIEGTVIHGRRLGRTLGFPTANIDAEGAEWDGVEAGVYASQAEVGGQVYDAMSNLGRRPSVGGEQRLLETHLFGFSGDLYGERIRVRLLERIRGEERYPTVDDLRAAIEHDAETIKQRTAINNQ